MGFKKKIFAKHHTKQTLINSISHEKNSQERSSIVSHENTGLIKKTQEKRAVLFLADLYKIYKAKSKF